MEATQEHCRFCFDVLVAHLTGEQGPKPSFPDTNCPLFVTWSKVSQGRGRTSLRGCIGSLEPRQLHTALKDYALTSALRDSRFSSVQKSEIPQLNCSVSLLSCFEPAADWKDWEIGRHGLIANFVDPLLQCKRTATFLPEVAAEQCWTKLQCVEALLKKSGYTGTISNELLSSVSVTRYQSSKAGISFADYASWSSSSSRQDGEPVYSSSSGAVKSQAAAPAFSLLRR